MTTITQAYNWHRKDRKEVSDRVRQLHKRYVRWTKDPGTLPPVELFEDMQRLFRHFNLT